MEDGGGGGGTNSSPTALGLGISAPPPNTHPKFPSFFVWDWEGAQKCFILRDQTTGNLKSHHLPARVTLHGHIFFTGPRSAVGNVPGYRCVSDCRSRGREFDPGPVPYFRGDWSWNNFYGHSPPFRWFIQEGLLSVTSESMCTNYWLTACSSLPRKKGG